MQCITSKSNQKCQKPYLKQGGIPIKQTDQMQSNTQDDQWNITFKIAFSFLNSDTATTSLSKADFSFIDSSSCL